MSDFERENEEVFAMVHNSSHRKVDLSETNTIKIRLEGEQK